MLTIIKKRERKSETYYTYDFDINRSGGFAFPCDENGVVDESKLNEYALDNYKKCMAHPEKFEWKGVKKHKYSYTEPAIGKCHCGEEFELIPQYMGACECPNCGQWYNIFGQELLPPVQWEEY